MSFSATHQKLMNFKKRRRASTSSPGKKYESPGTPPPFYRKRFFSLPKNALHSPKSISVNTNYCSDGSNEISDECESNYYNYRNLISDNKKNANKHLESILKKTRRSSLLKNSNQPQQHCYDKNRHMNDRNDYLQLPPPCTCPYFGDVPIKSSLKQTEVKILSSSNNNSLSSSLLSSSSTLFPITTAAAVTTTLISSKNAQDNSLNSTQMNTSESNTINSEANEIQNNSDTLNTNMSNTNNINSSMKKASPNNSYLSLPPPTPVRKLSYSKTASVVIWDSQRNKRRGSSFGGARTTLLLTPTKVPSSTSMSHHHHHQHQHLHTPISALRRSATSRNHNNINYMNESSLIGGTSGARSGSNTNLINGNCTDLIPSSPSPLKSNKISSSPCLLQRNATVRSHHSRNSSVISRNSSRHGRIIRLEQKATKVLGVVFFTFVILWAPFFVLNLLPTVCGDCEEKISHWVFDIVTWLGYASSMVNPIFYTIFNKVFRQAFKKVLLCQYSRTGTQGSAAGLNHWRPKR